MGGEAPAHEEARKTRAAATERTPHAVREKRKHRETSKKKTKTLNGCLEKRARETTEENINVQN